MLDNRTDSKANWLLGAAKTGEAFGAIMMSSLVKGLGRLMALLTQLRHGERTMGSLGQCWGWRQLFSEAANSGGRMMQEQ